MKVAGFVIVQRCKDPDFGEKFKATDTTGIWFATRWFLNANVEKGLLRTVKVVQILQILLQAFFFHSFNLIYERFGGI